MPERVSWTQAAAWRFDRHRLAGRATASEALDVVSRISGLHAQVASSAVLALHAPGGSRRFWVPSPRRCGTGR